MKKLIVLSCGLIASAAGAFAQSEPDSLRIVDMESVHVISTRATGKTPMVFTNIDREEIAKVNFGQDLPFILQTTPSVVATSDAGAGVGYTGIRIRGTDATRINVTTNGIPMNDSESHGMFWVNTPDFAASAEDIQVQRGVGTSTNGAGAFGGSINIKTESFNPRPYTELSGSYGSYNTHRESLKVGTGLIGGKWAFNARLSNIHSDGYIDRASTDLKSFYAQGAYYGKNTVVKLIVFGGKEQTYHAWNGIGADQLAADRRYNPSGEIEKAVLNADGSVTKSVVGFYKDQTDNYRQYNYQLHVNQRLNDNWNLNAALHLTDGEGYYEEYKNARTLVEYGLRPFDSASPVPEPYVKNGQVTKSNLVRQKRMDNIFGGGVFSLDYKSDRLQASLGGAANHYDGDHFGRVIWVQNYAGDSDFQPGHEYYRNVGKKTDANVYLKANWEAFSRFYLYGDVQYRYINYKIDGANDNWDWINEEMQKLDVNNNYNFFNPKAGILYEFGGGMNVYGSVAVAHKEPTRNNFTDAKSDRAPKAERLIDYEFGYNYNGPVFRAGANFYYMDYKDQLVLTGEVNEIGEALADNVKDSYRMGVELMAGTKITDWLRWDINATFSRNKIKNYTEFLDDMDSDWESLYTQTARSVGTTTISFSPSVIFGSLISFDLRGWNAAFQSTYVSKQYLTNSEQDDLSLDGYFVNNLRVGYTFKLPALKSLTLGVAVNNIFNEKYCSNGWGYSALIHGADGSTTRSNDIGYFPQATTNVMGNIIIRF